MNRAAHVRLAGPHPGWGGSLARSVFAGVALGMLSGFLTLLISILSLWVAKFLLHRPIPDIRIVYREVAPAVAATVAAIACLGNLVWERTHPAPVAAGQRT